jgi:hypothetical protein
MLAGTLAQRPAQDRDVLVQVVFFDHDVGPDGFEQRRLFHHFAAVFDQVEQRVEGLDGQRNGVRLVCE